MAAGDAYTRRYDESIADIPNKVKVIDDTLLWANDLAGCFFLTCKFLTKCGTNSITLNPKKFHYGEDTVEFAGFEITTDSVRPSDKFLKTRPEFPTPIDITGIRS